MRAIIAALVLCGAACADSEPELPAPSEDVLPPESDAIVDPVGEIRSAELCEVPADAEGACALVCDPDALVELYVPEGVCATFECVVNGTTRRFGGCKL